MEFKVGDRVTATGNVPGYHGAGTVVYVDENSSRFTYLIRFDCVPGSRIWAFTDSVKPLSVASKILITSDGQTTTARLYDGKKVTKTAEAKCNPSDKFDFVTGADLAYQRLVHPEPKPTYYNGKVVCVDNEGNEYIYTIGKVYTIKDGVFSADDGKLAFGQYKVKDFADFCEQTRSKFIEYKGEA